MLCVILEKRGPAYLCEPLGLLQLVWQQRSNINDESSTGDIATIERFRCFVTSILRVGYVGDALALNRDLDGNKHFQALRSKLETILFV